MKAYRNMLRRKVAGFTLVEIMIVVLIIGILLAIAIPNFIQAREAARARACVANLKQIDSGKQQYLMDNKTSTFTSVAFPPTGSGTVANTGGIVPTYVRSLPLCPEGGTYTTNDANTLPTCSIATVSAGGQTYYHVLS